MSATKDWYDWHQPYTDPDSPLSRRLRLVQDHVDSWLDERPEPVLTVVSACAGQGRDLLGVLARRPDASRVRATLIEYDSRNTAVAQAEADRLGVAVTATCADAGLLESYADAVPADLVLFAGVFGNMGDAEVRRTVAALPRLCASGATVIWTRTRRAPDLTPSIRTWFAEAGFAETAFHAPDDVLFSVGVHLLTAVPPPLGPGGRLFRFG
ncbi:class I SAM-dependent methyltransferase [Catellatospora sichuanensis]|uniref:class I SAM-dependent methyltransferase n=1 Tax=Catellatospora sichuanensis TaxID=1969805 RepID=UPI0011828215|nr:class I SAM-dependent methyltransferase [Catellatospora sichuanensis]